MIGEAWRLQPSMVLVGLGFASLFMVLVVSTVVAVVADDTPEAPALEGLPIVSGVEVVDSIATCNEMACDGYGVLLMGIEDEASVLRSQLVRHWRTSGWHQVPCRDDGGLCFGDRDLRISLRDWSQVDPIMAPTLVAGVADRGLPANRLLYIRYYRCGAIYSCE